MPRLRIVGALAAFVLLGAVVGSTAAWGLPAPDGPRPNSLASTNPGSAPAAYATALRTKEEMGRLLFFDRRLSGDAGVSCASCHQPEKGWADGMRLSAGYPSTLYFRNTPTLLNASKMPVYYWDGRFASGDLESVIRDHLAEAHFMNIDGLLLVERLRQVTEYETAFQQLYGGDATYGRALNALAAFLGSLQTGPENPYLRFKAGDREALSPQARQGLELFNGKAGCASCHSGGLLSDGKMHATGVPATGAVFAEPQRQITFRRFFKQFGVAEYASLRSDPGLFAITQQKDDRGKFRTPSLLEVAQTAPYMHDGSAATLEDVVRFYIAGGGDSASKDPLLVPLNLTDEEAAALAAFLKSLASAAAQMETEASPPYGVRPLGRN